MNKTIDIDKLMEYLGELQTHQEKEAEEASRFKQWSSHWDEVPGRGEKFKQRSFHKDIHNKIADTINDIRCWILKNKIEN